MAAFDFDRAVRWARFDPGKTVGRRSDDQLPFVGDTAEAGQQLLLDTCVYIDALQGRAPDVLIDLLKIRHVNHSMVAVQELMHAIGVLNPRHPGSKTAIEQIAVAIRGMRHHRIFAPDSDTLGRAALLAGILSRLQGYRDDARYRALHDCVLFLQAQKLGFSILTANVSDFDCLLQLIPSGRVLFYRRA